jgi:transposase-like protein
MDFSLLVGIHDGPVDSASREGAWPVGRRRFQQCFGGLRDEQTGAIYFVHLIDVLQRFDFSKQAERFFKTKLLTPLKSLVLDDGKVSCPSCKHSWPRLPPRQDSAAAGQTGIMTDMLERYRCSRCGFSFQVSSLRDTNISSIEPDAYRNRFLDFLRNKVIVTNS